ncbi:uncharacterized protein K444DRAFT_107736 [Hyaloscypha bicolor E]|uniref:Uncharacterized protein n=1 Tax=Hyaloscypha bicolor E TaxID=1095630 RepID=A0A2J6SUY7_9HELO|nr:uncharacterized protein K444DRAFT_107736 [Hyaloscypha bicolor E]PMD54580.1 hypothetical protein K444DRAFT_107736 [Hyaloscypha bicolor E]
MLYNSLSFSYFLCLYLELLPDWRQLRIFTCSAKRVSDLHGCYQLPCNHTRLRSFSRSLQSTCKSSTSPSRQSSGLRFRMEIWAQNLTLSICWFQLCGHSYSSKSLGPRLLSDGCDAERQNDSNKARD